MSMFDRTLKFLKSLQTTDIADAAAQPRSPFPMNDLETTYFVSHPDGSFSLADPQPLALQGQSVYAQLLTFISPRAQDTFERKGHRR